MRGNRRKRGRRGEGEEGRKRRRGGGEKEEEGGMQNEHQGKAQSSLVCCHGPYFKAMSGAASQQGHGYQVGHGVWDLEGDPWNSP